MKSHPWFRAALLTALAFSLASCSKSGSMTAPTSNGGGSSLSNDEQITQELAAHPEFWQEDLSTSATPYEENRGTFSAIQPLRFWRQIDNVTSERDVVYGNPDSLGRPRLATVTIHRTLTGKFFVAARTITGEDTTYALVDKPLLDDWTRRVALVRHPARNDSGLSRWRLAGTSGVDVRTRDGVTRIQSLRIQAGRVDTTVTDPLELHRLRQIIHLPPDVEVVLTATTAANDDVVLFHGLSLRRRFANNGDGTHTFRFPSGRFPSLRHFGVDALSNGTLFDDQAKYDSNAWVLPYVVGPCPMPANDGRD